MSKRGIGSNKAAQAARDYAKAQKQAKKAKAAEKQARIEAHEARVSEAVAVAEEIKAEGYADPLTDPDIEEIELTETFDA